MQKITTFSTLLLVVFFSTTYAQLPYYTGFDNTAQQAGWAEYKKGVTTSADWSYSSFTSYSTPNCLYKNYTPGVTGVTDDWFVSPAFTIPTGGKMDSIRYAFSGFSVPGAGDTIALYLLNGSQNPSLASSKTLLFDFRNTEYVTDNTYRIKSNINLSASSGQSYFAIRYRNAVT
ncbi:MAG: hypothetical protein ACOYLE_03525 [Bacteroidales bacterium]